MNRLDQFPNADFGLAPEPLKIGKSNPRNFVFAQNYSASRSIILSDIYINLLNMFLLFFYSFHCKIASRFPLFIVIQLTVQFLTASAHFLP